MRRTILILAGIGFAILIMIGFALYIPNSLPVGSDFSAIYFSDLALVNGIPIYDIPEMETLAIQSTGLPRDNFFMPRFPYPPWYALSTFYLGLLPIYSAATLWFEINLVMLFLSIWFLTAGWPRRLRLIAFPLGLLFLPVLGVLSVGQFDLPVLLGTSILIYSLRKENSLLSTIGMVLLTFKPHIGALIFLAVLAYLIGRQNSFGRRTIRLLLIAGVLLFFSGFAADSKWLVSYSSMLLNYQGEGNVFSCSECASAPVYLSRWFFDASLSYAAVIAVVLLVVLVGILFAKRNILLESPELWLTSSVLLTLLVSPYLYNYDFILLIVPFAIIAPRSRIGQKVIVIICYLAPTFVIAIYGRAGNISLIIVTFVMVFLLFRQSDAKVDVSALSSYNKKQ